MFFDVVYISWKIKCWLLLMHGVTMKSIWTVQNTKLNIESQETMSSM